MIRKDPHTRNKGYHPKWSSDIYEIKFINKDNDYVLNHDRKRLFQRHELMKI